jgi:hypothetical protein
MKQVPDLTVDVRDMIADGDGDKSSFELFGLGQTQ